MTGLDLSPDGRRLVYQDGDHVRTLDLQTHKRTGSLDPADARIMAG